MTNLPELVVAEDIAEMLRVTRSAVHKMAARGELGRFFSLGRRRFVWRREALLEALAEREHSQRRASNGALPPPKPETLEVLRRGRSRSRA